jgi:hypothetical protein
MQVSGRWADLLAEMGNEPGVQRGDVCVRLAPPLQDEWLPSGDITFLAEAGNFYGIYAHLPDGRQAYWPASSVLAIEDAVSED